MGFGFFRLPLRPSEKRVALLCRVCSARHARGFLVRLSLPLGYSVSACVAEPHTLRRRLRPSEKRGFMPPSPACGGRLGRLRLGQGLRRGGRAVMRTTTPSPTLPRAGRRGERRMPDVFQIGRRWFVGHECPTYALLSVIPAQAGILVGACAAVCFFKNCWMSAKIPACAGMTAVGGWRPFQAACEAV